MKFSTSTLAQVGGLTFITAFCIAEVVHFFLDPPLKMPVDFQAEGFIDQLTFSYPTYFVSCALANFPGHAIGNLILTPATIALCSSMFLRAKICSEDICYKQCVYILFSTVGTLGVMAFSYHESLILHTMSAFACFFGISGIVMVDENQILPQIGTLSENKVLTVLSVLPRIFVSTMMLGLFCMHVPGLDSDHFCFLAALSENGWLLSSIAYVMLVSRFQPLTFEIQHSEVARSGGGFKIV